MAVLSRSLLQHKQIKIFRFNKILFIGWHEIEILFLFSLFSMWETINLFWIGARRKGFARSPFSLRLIMNSPEANIFIYKTPTLTLRWPHHQPPTQSASIDK